MAEVERRTVSLPEVEYQLLRRIAYQDERTQQDVLAEAVRRHHEWRAMCRKRKEKKN